MRIEKQNWRKKLKLKKVLVITKRSFPISSLDKRKDTSGREGAGVDTSQVNCQRGGSNSAGEGSNCWGIQVVCLLGLLHPLTDFLNHCLSIVNAIWIASGLDGGHFSCNPSGPWIIRPQAAQALRHCSHAPTCFRCSLSSLQESPLLCKYERHTKRIDMQVCNPTTQPLIICNMRMGTSWVFV